jgi:hypothetical protein
VPVLVGQMQHHASLAWDVEHRNAHEGVEHPACRRVLHALAFLVWEGRSGLLEGRADTVCEGRLNEETDDHDHPQGQDPLGLFESEGGGPNLWGWQEANPTFRSGWPGVSGEPGWGRSLALVPFVRREEQATLRVDACPTVCEPRRPGPCTMGDALVGLGPRAWAPALSRGGRGADGAVVEQRGLPAGGKTGARRRGIRGTGQRGPAQRLAGADLLVTVLAPWRIDGALGLRLALCRGEQEPALRDAPSARAHHVRARARRARRPRLGSGLGHDGLGVAPGRGAAGPPLEAGISELWQVLGTRERPIGPQGGGAIGRTPWGKGLVDDLTEVCRLTAGAPEGVQQHGHAGRVLDNEIAHALGEVRAMLPAVAVGEVEDLLVGRRRAVLPASDMATGTLEMSKGRREPSPLRRRGGQQTVQCCDAKVLARSAGTPQGGIVQMTGWDRRGDEPRGGLILEKVGHELTFRTP